MPHPATKPRPLHAQVIPPRFALALSNLKKKIAEVTLPRSAAKPRPLHGYTIPPWFALALLNLKKKKILAEAVLPHQATPPPRSRHDATVCPCIIKFIYLFFKLDFF
jgi:hypothetical protein